jgi:hypothetical protein
MKMMVLSQLEENIYELPLEEQLWLMERLAQNIRNIMATKQDIEMQLGLWLTTRKSRKNCK